MFGELSWWAISGESCSPLVAQGALSGMKVAGAVLGDVGPGAAWVLQKRY